MRAEVLDVAGLARRFLLAEPSGAASVIVLSLHGSRSLPGRQARLSSMERLCSSGAVVAFRAAAPPLGSGFEWDLEGDVEYLRVLVGGLGPSPRAAERAEPSGAHRPPLPNQLQRPGEVATVTLFVSEGAGHTRPGSRLPLSLRLILGRTSSEIDATTEIWRSTTASV
jgi:poly(3-hydroxybutyrate) depolymerase